MHVIHNIIQILAEGNDNGLRSLGAPNNRGHRSGMVSVLNSVLEDGD